MLTVGDFGSGTWCGSLHCSFRSGQGVLPLLCQGQRGGPDSANPTLLPSHWDDVGSAASSPTSPATAETLMPRRMTVHPGPLARHGESCAASWMVALKSSLAVSCIHSHRVSGCAQKPLHLPCVTPATSQRRCRPMKAPVLVHRSYPWSLLSTTNGPERRARGR